MKKNIYRFLCIIFIVLTVVSSIKFEIEHIFHSRFFSLMDVTGWVLPSIFGILAVYFFIKSYDIK